MSTQRGSFVYRPGAVVLLAALAVATSLIGWLQLYSQAGWLGNWRTMAAAVVLIPFISWAIAQPLWWFSGRKGGAFDVVFLGLVGCGVLSYLIAAKEVQYAHDVQVAQEIQEARDALRKRQLERSGEALEEVRKRREEREREYAESRFLRYSNRLTPEEIETLQALDAELLDDVRARADAYLAAAQRNQVSGPAQWLRFQTIDALEEEIAKHNDLYTQTRSFMDAIDVFKSQYEQRIDALELSEAARIAAIAEMERVLQGWEQAGVYEIRRLDVLLMENNLQILRLLREAWGAWSFDEEEQQFEFESPELEAEFSRLIQESLMISRELQRVQVGRQPQR